MTTMVSRRLCFLKSYIVGTLILMFGLFLSISTAKAQTTSFTYQGRLTDGGTPANGSYDFQFTLWDALNGGAQQPQPGPITLTKNAVFVSAGTFVVQLDFGASAFPGADRFLEVSVRPASVGSFVTLLPRQQINSTPYAVRTLNASSADSLSNACDGCVQDSQINQVSGSKVSGAIAVTSVPSGSTNYIQNSMATQAGANFNIDGKGTANIFDAATQFNIGGSRVFVVNGGDVTANGVGAVPNSNTFGGAEAGASVIPNASNAAGNFNTLFGVKAGMNTANSVAAAPFDGCCNSFFGNLVGLKNTAGHSNAFFGGAAGIGNTIGNSNSFFGDGAGTDFYNPNVERTGSLNTFVGSLSGGGVTTGSNNTFVGANTSGAADLNNATAIGAGAQVTQSNSVVLGNNANVGIGTSTPGSKLTVAGLIETTTGGVKFPDGSIQFSAAAGGGGLPPGSPNYIQSNPASQQAGVSFNIGGNGTAAGTFSGNVVNAATQFNLGGNRIVSAAGNANLFMGFNAGQANTPTVGGQGTANTYVGVDAGKNNTSGEGNSFFGLGAGSSGPGSSGSHNGFFGWFAGSSNTTGVLNNFFGGLSGGSNTTGSFNSFFGDLAGASNTNGNGNTMVGVSAGTNGLGGTPFANTGSRNTFLGMSSGRTNITGSDNTVIGALANVGADNLNFATALGSNAVVNTSDTIVLGKVAGTYNGVARPADTVQIPGDLNVAGALTLNIVNATTQYNLGGNRILSTAGFQNTFVGLNTGASNTTGCCNAFFGFHAGSLNNANDNSFFGNNAGAANTTGTRNSFFGSVAGFSNQVGTDNSFFGVNAGRNNTANINSFFGSSAGFSNTTGFQNSFFGANAGLNNVDGFSNSFFGNTAGYSNVSGIANSFFGAGAGLFNTASYNSFFGTAAGGRNTSGTNNTFVGTDSGFLNETGSDNSFFGKYAGLNNKAGQNSFFGSDAGQANTTGFWNSFFGYGAGYSNTTGSSNAFFGVSAGFHNTTQLYNTFIGSNAGSNNGNGDATSSAIENTFIGSSAGNDNSTGGFNSFVGAVAGSHNTMGNSNSFFGRYAGLNNATGSSNTIIGTFADLGANNLTNATAIGANASVTQSNSLVLGSINGVNGATDDTKVGIGTTAPTSRLTVAGLIETTTGGVKFPDGTIQITAAAGGSVTSDGATLNGNGTAASPLAIKSGGVNTTQLADSAVTSAKISSGQVVKSLNGLTDNVTLAAGSNVTITPSGNTLTISATGGGGGGSFIQNQTTQQTSANFNIDGTGKANIFDAATQYSLGGNRVLSLGVEPLNGNLFAGSGAGQSGTNLTSGNSLFGFNAGAATTANWNSFFGYNAGLSNTTGDHNSFFGREAGKNNVDGAQNAFFGDWAGLSNTNGFGNAFFGEQAGQLSRGSNNVFVGYLAGGNNTFGSNNTFIGSLVGPPLGTGSLTYASAFGAGAVVNSSNTVVLGRPADTVIVPGTFLNPSDARLKTGIANLRYGLNEVMRLRPVTWTWKDRPGDKTGLGLVAQDVRPILPELVEQGTDKDGMLSLNYIGLLPVVIRAIQEQQATITSLRNEVVMLQRQNTAAANRTTVSFVESIGAINTCNGNITTDANGEATVTLPDDFEARNRDFRYQLTVIGQFAQAIISAEIKNNRFTIKTDKSNVKVSWQVTGSNRNSYREVDRTATAQADLVSYP
jgi:Chaperone of endosialidase